MAACMRLTNSVSHLARPVRSLPILHRLFCSTTPTTSTPTSPTLTFPTGFRAAGVRCGIKKKAEALDFAMIASTTPCTAAAVFTTNKFQAAPVIASRTLLQSQADAVGGVVINSGCANACTGAQGLSDAQSMMRMAADVGVHNSLVMSTGVIGPFLDLTKIQRGLTLVSQALSPQREGWESASRAIMTTDTVPKLLAKEFDMRGKEGGTGGGGERGFRIAGMCKGAGMIHPNMATMLGVVTTDAAVSVECLKVATRYAVDRSFNAISVDGDMSTNDTVAVLANGQAQQLTKQDAITSVSHPSFAVFQSALTSFCQELSQKLVRDGEGATKFVTIEVRNGSTFAEARQVASSIATSALVKTAMYGQDANWGRIVCAVGYAGVEVDPNRVSLWFVDDGNDSAEGNLHLLKDGQPYQTDEARATELVRRKDIHIRIDLGKGHEHATMWTCDFSIDYVKINADYRS